MSIHVALNHRTAYRYDRLVSLSPQTIRLRPAPHCRTPVLAYSMRVSPANHFTNWLQDPHGNYLARLVFPEKTREFTIEVDLVAELSAINPFDFFLEEDVERYPFTYEPTLKRDLAPYLEAAMPGPKLRDFVEAARCSNIRTNDFLVGLNQALAKHVRYIIRMEPGVQTPEETLTLGSGSCRDSAWLLVQALRHLGLAARFVSGYLIQLTADEKSLDGPSGPAADFTDLHAWAEVYAPGAGWIGLDPTSGLLASEGHLPLVCTPDPASAAPVSGETDECEVEFSHHMSITRVLESPRVTKPYTDEQWLQIETLGHRIDADLISRDVRLTMGGEPTFVSIDDRDGDEWKTTAMGPNKRKIAGSLLKRLEQRFAPGGLLHYGQSKWYPGEPLPRWALGCYWRRDGQPVWNNDALIADEQIDYRHGEPEAKRFIMTLTRALNVDAGFVVPAYEDAWYYLWKERRLPTNVDPLQSNLKDEEERARLSRLFELGLNTIVGYALPLRRRRQSAATGYWTSGPWFLRAEHMFLIPGDSPMGYRLPLDSLPWVAPGDYPYFLEMDPAAPREPLASPRGQDVVGQSYVPGQPPPRARSISPQMLDPLDTPDAFGLAGPAGPFDVRAPRAHQSAPWLIRTALCVEPRLGRLHIFMPPLRHLEDYLDLISAIEATAAAVGTPVVIEGEPPPADPRLDHLKVTPDPGVIEVNLQPAHSWSELVAHTTALYEEARLSRLGTEKFMLDGRHTGTGGGNHVVLGGSTPTDSPLLRRPDLLRSLLGYWHNHPSLSFLFSGLFIGPTSQHPRVDEARNDQVYELEIAFSQVRPGSMAMPWTVDRAFRNLLVDVSGNTHRAEFCIDKLFDPNSTSGRQGLLELRAFEMPPHARMSLTQQLLLRALVSRFWNDPFDLALVRWGTELHDRFMLPHFVAADFAGVLDDLRASGYDLRPEWFAPHLEFRFPVAGSISPSGVLLELRQALEPWHVLGEEGGGSGTVRYVDSSLERLQVKVNGLVGSRHVVTCNGRRVPLHPTGTAGEFVAGVRYRAWQPPSGLHPTIPVHAPLVFDLVDLWNGRSIGGCTYHVAHPGGLSHERFPVNAFEAEGRRLARFNAFGHTPGAMTVPVEERNADFPFTLDLRRA
jgi:uncharacterized protein (DUF2126 family)